MVDLDEESLKPVDIEDKKYEYLKSADTEKQIYQCLEPD